MHYGSQKGTLMTREEFLRVLEAEMGLPSGSLREEQPLSDVEGWDSMAALQFIAVADEKAAAHVSATDIGKAKTVAQLLSLLGDKVTV
jgi:acyl carrier protein